MERMEKQTAVRYAQELINIILYYLDDDELERINDVFEYANEMEKQQIFDAWNNSVDYFIPFLNSNDESEEYYNKTFK
jgi:hypothetical protein